MGPILLSLRKIYLEHAGNLHDELVSGDDVFLLHSLKKDNRNKIVIGSNQLRSMIITGASANLFVPFYGRGRDGSQRRVLY